MLLETICMECSKCRARVSVQRPEVLRNLGNRVIGVGRRLCWCSTCSAVRVCESIESEADLKTAKRFAEESIAAGELGLAEPAEDPTEFDVLLQWRAARKSPPRCLTCTGTEVVLAVQPDDGEPLLLEHAGCGGNWSIRSLDVEESERPVITLDAEGFPIA